MTTTVNSISELDNFAQNYTSIQQFYEDAVILVTGGTGYIGKLLLEKLLRACPGIKKLILIVRNKKGKTPRERIEELFNNGIYDKMKIANPNFSRSIVVCEGDCSEKGLGLSENDRNMIISEVTMVFHIAATVRFDEPFRVATKINLEGTKEILNLCKQIHHLKVMIHVSTAYSNCTQYKIEEKFYEPARDPEDFINYVNGTSDDELDKHTKEILGEYPNTYTYTKALAEEVVRRHMKALPIVVYRPSIVTATCNEPIRGWVDSLAGPTGLMIGVGAGLIRTMEINENLTGDLVPVDMVVNSMLAAAWQRAQTIGEKPIEVINYVSSTRNPLTWKYFLYWTTSFGHVYPLSSALWYYALMFTKFHILYLIYIFFLHTIPAYLMDAVLLIKGQKPTMRKIYAKINKVSQSLVYFSTNQWSWDDNNIQQLWQKMDDRDKQLFQFNVEEFQWDEYFFFHIKSIRMIVLKDPFTTLEAATKRMARLKWAHYSFVSVIVGLLIYTVYNFGLKQLF